MPNKEKNNANGSSFEDYKEMMVDPGIWLLMITASLCFFIMLVVVPTLVAWKVRQQKKQELIKEATDYVHVASPCGSQAHKKMWQFQQLSLCILTWRLEESWV